MKKIIISLFIMVACIDVSKLADAIKQAENSEKYPYGVKSVECHGEADCRRVCINSIKNNLKRYDKTDKAEDFISFMGRRYSPPAQNPNWVRLVKYFYDREACKK